MGSIIGGERTHPQFFVPGLFSPARWWPSWAELRTQTPICKIFAHTSPYARFLLTSRKPARSPERLSVRGPYARCFFLKLDFQKNFWYNFKKKHLRRAAHQKNSRSDVRTGLPQIFPVVALLFLRR